MRDRTLLPAILLLPLSPGPAAAVAAPAPPQAAAVVARYAARYGVRPELIAALIDVESGWNPGALSARGAMGLMQLMPETARRFGARDPWEIEQNIAAGTRYLAALLWEFHGDLRLVAAAYYAGEGRIGREQLDCRSPEVVAYVEAVRSHYILRLEGRTSRRSGR